VLRVAVGVEAALIGSTGRCVMLGRLSRKLFLMPLGDLMCLQERLWRHLLNAHPWRLYPLKSTGRNGATNEVRHWTEFNHGGISRCRIAVRDASQYVIAAAVARTVAMADDLPDRVRT
jgi:hypothetical protein